MSTTVTIPCPECGNDITRDASVISTDGGYRIEFVSECRPEYADHTCPEPPREPGWYLCTYGDTPCAMRWDGADWRWPSGDGIRLQDTVIVLGAVTLNEGVEL